MSESGSQSHHQAANSKPHKIFVTGLDGNIEMSELQAELRKIFSNYGEIVSVVAKRGHNHEYSYAFIDFKEDTDATVAIRKENNTIVGGSKISVMVQDSDRKKRGTGEGCFKCGKPGHFAKDCRYNDRKRQRSYSKDRTDRDKKKKKKRYDSSDYSRSRSPSQRKKQKKKRSKSGGKKHSKSKKSKKQRRKSYSDSD